MVQKTNTIPLLTKALEPYQTTPEGLSLWKTKGVELTAENILEHVFILSSDLAVFFDVRHDHLVSQNIRKLLKEGYLVLLPNVREKYKFANLSESERIVYALTRHQTERLIMDFVGPRARRKKFEILIRFQEMEIDLLHGEFAKAQRKALSWDGVKLLEDFGFASSLPGGLASKKDIAGFLGVSLSTLTMFLRRHADEITPVKLDRQAIRAVGSRAGAMNGYPWEEVVKVVFWLDSEKSAEIKRSLLGQVGIHLKAGQKPELVWRNSLAKVFFGLGFCYQHPIPPYRVDYLVEALRLVLECDGEEHEHYDHKKEKARERFLSRRYALVRFSDKVSLEDLVNAILHARPGKVIRVGL